MSSSKRDILRTAVRLFAQQGYAATGIREIGAALGLNSATLYHHIGGGKEEILEIIVRDCMQALLRDGAAAVGRSEDPVTQLVMLVSSHVGMSALNPLTARVTDQEMRGLSPPRYAVLLALRDDYESLYATVLERGIRTGRFILDDMHIARLALLEMSNGVSHWFRPNGRLRVTQVQEHFVRFACRMVGCAPTDSQVFSDDVLMPPVRWEIEPVPDSVPDTQKRNVA